MYKRSKSRLTPQIWTVCLHMSSLLTLSDRGSTSDRGSPGGLIPSFIHKEVQGAGGGKVVESGPQRIQRLRVSSLRLEGSGVRSLLPGMDSHL